MAEKRSFRDRQVRPPTAAEVRRQEELEASGVADVYLSLDEAPPAFWECVLQATHWQLISEGAFAKVQTGRDWWDEMRWQEGWPPLSTFTDPGKVYTSLIRDATVPFLPGPVDVYLRLSAIEHLLDVVGASSDFNDLVNDAAERFRVGIRLEANRFVDVTSRFIHREVVQPILELIAAPGFKAVNELYRKGFDRLLAGDYAGAVTAATSAVEEMLRESGLSGPSLKELAKDARARGRITPGVEQTIVKLNAYRDDSDAHRVGTDERELARLVLHLTASLLLYLGRTAGNQG